MEKVINRWFSGKHPVIIVTLLVMLGLINVVFMESYANLILTLPEALLVLYLLLIRKDIEDSLILHVVFCLTGFDATSGSTELQLMSYPEVKLFGPITLSYVILGLIWVIAVQKPIVKEYKKTMIFRFRRVMIILMLYGILAGILGLYFLGYRFGDFIIPLVYTSTGFVLLDIFVRINSTTFLEKCYYCSLYLLISAPIVAFTCFFILNIRADYSGLDALLYNEAFMLFPALLLVYFYKEPHKPLITCSIVLYFICVMTAGRGGFFFNIAASFFIAVFLVYFAKETRDTNAAKVGRITIPVMVIALVTYIGTMDFSLNLGTRKLNELISMFEALGTVTAAGVDITGISDSPYIRIAEFLNILDNGISHPFGLLFGRGYGGYYTDSTHLFENVDVSLGGFPMEVVNSGKYGTAHSFLPVILLYNGLLGLFLICKLGISYLKKIKYSPLVFAAFTLFFYSFYFNPSLFMAASFSLYAAESKLMPHYD